MVARRASFTRSTPLVRGRERRWNRRSRRCDGEPRISRLARRRRDLAQPDLSVPERRLGVRRSGLHGRPSRPGHTSRTWMCSSPRRGGAGSACCSISSRITRPTGTPGFTSGPSLRWADDVPNNWQALFGGGSAWTFDEERGRHYLHNFAPEQPDLDWWNPEVRSSSSASCDSGSTAASQASNRRRARPGEGPRPARRACPRRARLLDEPPRDTRRLP